MEEKELFEEIKPLIEEYKEYANQETPDVYNWRDTRVQEEIKKEYSNDIEGELLQEIDETKDPETRRKLVEELIEIRETKKAQMRSTIFEKAKAFVNDEKEKMNKEIEEKRQSLEEEKEEKRKKLEEKQQKLEERQQLRRDINKRSKALTKYLKLMKKDLGKSDPLYYKAVDEKLANMREKENLSKDIDALEKECEGLKFEYEDFIIENDEGLQESLKRLSDFEEVYGKIDFESEEAIELLEGRYIEIKENEQEQRQDEDRIKEEEQKAWEIYDEEAEKQQDEWKRQQELAWEKHDENKKKNNEKLKLKQQLRERLDEIEKGNRDLLLPSYFKFRDIANEKDVKDVLKALEGKTLLDIYEGQLAYIKEGSPLRKQIEAAIKELKERQKGKPEETEPKGATSTTKTTGTRQPKGVKQEGIKPEGTMAGGQVYKDGKAVPIDNMGQILDMQEKQILREELEQRLAELEVGFEDIVGEDENYKLLKDDLLNRENIEYLEFTINSLKEKDILDMYEGMLAQTEKPEEREELESIINQIKERQAEIERAAQGKDNQGTEEESKVTKNITNIYIGINGIEITFEDNKGKESRRYRNFNDLKENYSMTEREKKERIAELVGEKNLEKAAKNQGKQNALDVLNDKLVEKIDPNVIDALIECRKEEGIDLKEIRQKLNTYIMSLKGKGQAKEECKKILTYSREGIDFFKMHNLLKMLRGTIVFQQLNEFSYMASKSGIAQIEYDRPGFFRRLFNRRSLKRAETVNTKLENENSKSDKQKDEDNEFRSKVNVTEKVKGEVVKVGQEYEKNSKFDIKNEQVIDAEYKEV